VASTDVEVLTPVTPFINIVGGNQWPAGSLIQIELHKHFSGPYDLYFSPITHTVSAVLIESNISPNAAGFYQTTFVIPAGTPGGDYEIRTEPAGGGPTEATTTIEVSSVPLIQLAEGSIVLPGSNITVQLLNHAPNDSFQIFLDGNLLFNIPTDASGQGTLVYDLSNLPGLDGGPFALESRKDGVVVATTDIFIIAPDLQVTDIQYPPGPPLNVEIPMTVTVLNNSDVPLAGEYFDVDLYVNPLHPPTTSSQFPPGDYKLWANTVPAHGTIQVVFHLTLRGAQHTLYGRVDTSNYIVETDDGNNIYQELVVSTACVAQITNGLSSGANWTARDYGNADIPPSTFSVSGGAMNITSDGSSNSGTSDNMYLVYYTPQTLSGDFEVRVRVVSAPTQRQYATSGLEIRGDVGSASSPKVELGVIRTNSSGTAVVKVRPSYRDGGGVSNPAGDATISNRVWLRIVRSGNRFIYYYSDSDSATPPASGAWTQIGEATLANMGQDVTVGFFHVSASTGSSTASSQFDNFHLCLRDAGAPPPEDFPPGLMVCSGNLLQNSGFENSLLAPWTAPNGAVNKVPDEYQGVFSALMYTWVPGAHQQPVLAQPFTMPDWVISSTTTINLSLYQCVRDMAGSGAEPNDHLNAGLRTTGGTPTLVTTPTLVADGNTANSGPCTPGDFGPYSTNLAAAMLAAGNNPESYANQTLRLDLYDTSSNLSVCNGPGGGPGNAACYETDYRLDNVELEVCTTQPIPPHQPGQATIGGPLRVFVGGAPQPRPGVRVWTYRQNGELLTTYTLHDSTYHFYNVEPGEYVIYAEHWDGPNLYSAFTTVTVGADQIISNLSLLLR
jgi:hypothetical protein